MNLITTWAIMVFVSTDQLRRLHPFVSISLANFYFDLFTSGIYLFISSDQEVTETELIAIAIPANAGYRSPAAATGIKIVL